MSVWGKIFTAIRGGANEAAEAVVNTQDLRILDQEIRDSESRLARARSDLAILMGKEKIAGDKVADLEEKLRRDLAMLEQLVAQGREPKLQEQLAERISTLEGTLQSEASAHSEYAKTRGQLEAMVSSLNGKIASVKRDVDKVKVTASVQDAQKAIMSHGAGAGSTIGGAAATLARIKEKQAGQQATYEAQQLIEDATSGADLDRQLAAAGVLDGPSSASVVLQRVRARVAPPEALAAPQPTLAIGVSPDNA